MAQLPESLLRRSAEAKAKATGRPVDEILAEMRGEAAPSAPPTTDDRQPTTESAAAPTGGRDLDA
ncbi:MAG: hypothetical protein ABFR95_10105, partial [Actinomycetota bacterium]